MSEIIELCFRVILMDMLVGILMDLMGLNEGMA